MSSRLGKSMIDSHPTSKRATLPEERKARKHAADPQVTSDASSSDDDWFNKSLDDFEIPTKDVQSGDDSSEAAWFRQSSDVLQMPAKDPDDRWADRDEAETDGSLQADNGDVSSNYATARNDVAKDHPVETVDKQDEKSEAVMCETSCVPEKAGDHGPNSDKRTPCSEEGAARSDGETSDEEEETQYTHRSIGPTMKLTSTASGAQHGLTITGDRKSSRERESAEEGNGVPAERDEEWFQRNLKELPTLFNLTRIHRLTTARLQAIQTWLIRQLAEDSDDSDDDSDDDDDDDDDDGDTNCKVFIEFLESIGGDLTEVLTIFVKNGAEEKDNQTPVCKQVIRSRGNYYRTFLVVIKWLLGRKREAEAEADCELREYPLSFIARANLFFILWKKGAREEAADTLRPLQELRERKPDIYQRILCEEQGELGICYTELGPDFIPNAVAALEEIAVKKPKWLHHKWILALNLRRLTNAQHNWRQPMTDIVTPLLRAVDILVDVIQMAEEEGDLHAKVAAASELGEILSQCRFDPMRQSSVGQRGLDAGFDAAKCFDIVMQFEDARGPSLARAGKYFRYSGQLEKSEEALKRAVDLVSASKFHHQLALTLRKMALREKRESSSKEERYRSWRESWDKGKTGGPRSRQFGQGFLRNTSWSRKRAGDRNMETLERSMKVQMLQTLSREDKHVDEAMHHFNKALMLSHGDNTEAAYDLGLMYKALGEHRDAMDQFLMIVETSKEPAAVVKAWEQAGLANLEKSSQEEKEIVARKLQENGIGMLRSAILIQSRTVREFRQVQSHRSRAVWQSLHSLGQYLIPRSVEGVCDEESTPELWLLRLLRVYADAIPLLVSLQRCTEHNATDPAVLRGGLDKYLRDQHYEDAVLLSSLLRLTQQRHVLKAGIRDLAMRAHVQAARKRLLTDLEEGNVGSTFNSNMAETLFRWAFEDARPDSESSHPTFHGSPQPNSPKASRSPTSDALRVDSSPNAERDEDSEQDDEANEVLRDIDLEYHVLLVRDPRDPDAARAAQVLQHVLRDKCGLKTHLTEEDAVDVMRRVTLEAMDQARLLLFVLGKKEVSPELDEYIHEAVQRSPATATDTETTLRASLPPTRRRPDLLTLTLHSHTTLPTLLQNRPSFLWRPDVAMTTCSSWIDAVCKLFCFLVGADVLF